MGARFSENFDLLPGDWRVQKVGDLCKVGTGGTPSTKFPEYYEPATVNWIKSGDVKGFYIKVAEHKISKAGLENSAATLHPPGTVLMAMSGRGKTRATTAILGIEAACSQSVAAIIPGKEIDSAFLHFQFVRRYAEIRNITGSDDRSGLNMSLIRDIEMIIPPLPEQRKIAAVLGLMQQTIEQQEQLLQLTAVLKKALLHKLFTEGLRGEPQKQTEIGPVPESWEATELGQISHKPEYGFTESAKPSGNAQFLRITDIQEDGVQWESVPFCDCPEELIQRYLLADNDILFARIGATTGKSFLVKKPPAAVFASYLIRVRLKNVVSADFVSQFCNTRAYWHQIDTNKGSNLKGGINSSMLRRLLVPVPSNKKEQDEIATIFQQIDMKAAHYRRKHAALTALFRTLLHQLMTAQIRVHDLHVAELDRYEQQETVQR